MKSFIYWLLKRLIKPEHIRWIATEDGELGVEVFGKAFMMYKGESLDIGAASYRVVGKREFGEVVTPFRSLRAFGSVPTVAPDPRDYHGRY